MALVEYGLSPEYEQVVCWLCCTQPSFWHRLGSEMKPGGFVAEEAQQLLIAVRDYTAESPPPESWLTIREWLLKKVKDGELDPKTYRHIKVFIEIGSDIADDAGVTVEDAVSVAAPGVREEHKRLYVQNIVDEFGKGRDLSLSTTKLQELEHLGVAEKNIGVGIEDGFDSIQNQRSRRMLTTGIFDLDARLHGIPSGTETVIVGGPGDGKSMALSQIAAHSCEMGLNVAVATLEVSQELWYSRVYAALLRIPEEMISAGQKEVLGTARKKLTELLPVLGNMEIKYFTPQATPVDEVLNWVKECEAKWKQPLDVLVLDYADKIVGGKKSSNMYESMRDVYEGFRVWAHDNGHWVFTASQSKSRGSKDRKARRDVDDASDSMHKARVCDVMLTLNTSGDEDEDASAGREVSIFVAKNRLGKSRFTVGPLPVDFEYGRLTAP